MSYTRALYFKLMGALSEVESGSYTATTCEHLYQKAAYISGRMLDPGATGSFVRRSHRALYSKWSDLADLYFNCPPLPISRSAASLIRGCPNDCGEFVSAPEIGIYMGAFPARSGHLYRQVRAVRLPGAAGSLGRFRTFHDIPPTPISRI